MYQIMVEQAKAVVNAGGGIRGEKVSHGIKYLEQLQGVFEDREAFGAMDPKTLVYEVDSQAMVSEGTAGGLFFGTSYIHPGQVGNEYFMTKGHYHNRRESAEYYWGIEGSGLLLLMEESGSIRAEQVIPGSLHYIPGNTSHRLVNTGTTVLTVGACWPSDAGHDYKSIEENGFTARVVNVDGKPVVLCKEGS
ncbi:MAG: glucose-6-phosphate isomerase [Herbinix sp.]|jgi:glucose-6-phosphate isomerase|nr:glucose-6-phosphate isomerase [Herbinix sp.]